MIVKFFLYMVDSGNIILMLPGMPENDNFEDFRGNILFQNKLVIGGINWKKMVDDLEVEHIAWESSDVGFELAENHEWIYDQILGDFIDLGLIEEVENGTVAKQ